MASVLVFTLALSASGIFVYLLARLAPRVGLLDRPDGRKAHTVATPLVGGLGMACGVGCALIAFPAIASGASGPLLIATLALLLLGAADDRWDLPARLRLAVQVLVVLTLALNGSVLLLHLGPLLSEHSVLALGSLALPFTLIGLVGIINAFNMVDGMDGLCGLMALVTLGLLALVAGWTGAPQLGLILALCGGLIGFLVWNLRLPGRPAARVFMGDAGSMAVGLLIAGLLVIMSQAPQAYIPPVLALWLVALPTLDTLSLILHRMLVGRSPFAADRWHLHHLLLSAGLSVNQTLLAMGTSALLLALFGLLLWSLDVPEWMSLALFVAVLIGYTLATGRLRLWGNRRVSDRIGQPAPVEPGQGA